MEDMQSAFAVIVRDYLSPGDGGHNDRHRHNLDVVHKLPASICTAFRGVGKRALALPCHRCLRFCFVSVQIGVDVSPRGFSRSVVVIWFKYDNLMQ